MLINFKNLSTWYYIFSLIQNLFYQSMITIAYETNNGHLSLELMKMNGLNFGCIKM